MKTLTILLVCLLVGCDQRLQPTGHVKYYTRSGVVEGAIYNISPINSSITTIYDIENDRYFTVRYKNAPYLDVLYKEATRPGSKGDTLILRLRWPHPNEDLSRQTLPAGDIPNRSRYLLLRTRGIRE